MATQIALSRKCLGLVIPHSIWRARAVGVVGGVAVTPSYIARYTKAGAFTSDSALAPLTGGLGKQTGPKVPMANRRTETPTFWAWTDAQQAGLLETLLLVVTEETRPWANTSDVLRRNPGAIQGATPVPWAEKLLQAATPLPVTGVKTPSLSLPERLLACPLRTKTPFVPWAIGAVAVSWRAWLAICIETVELPKGTAYMVASPRAWLILAVHQGGL